MRRKLLVTKAQSDLMECMAYMTYVGAKDGTFAFLVPGKIYNYYPDIGFKKGF